MTEYYDMWKEMFNQNQKMMNDWMKGFGPANENVNDENTTKANGYGDFLELQQQWFKNWQNMYQGFGTDTNMFNNPYQTWMDMMNSYNPFSASKVMNHFNRDVFEKIQNSQKLYLGAFEQWQKFNEQFVRPGSTDYKKNMDTLIDQFNKMYMTNFIPLLPKEFQGLMSDSQSYFNTFYKSMENFLGPWAYAYQNIADIAMESIYSDPSKLSDSLRQWKAAYDKTFGILIKSPVVGSSRELIEQNNKAIDAMIEMVVALSEFVTKSSAIGYKYSEEAFKKYAESIENGEEVKSFKEFYDMWSKYVEDAMEEYFYTDEFSQLLATTAETSMNFKIQYDKVIEQALANLPIVTLNQVDPIFEKVYQLRRELREVQRELQDIKDSLGIEEEEN